MPVQIMRRSVAGMADRRDAMDRYWRRMSVMFFARA
jgi:hypothetical protein